MKVGTSFRILNKSGGYEPWDNVRPQTSMVNVRTSKWLQTLVPKRCRTELFHVGCNSSIISFPKLSFSIWEPLYMQNDMYIECKDLLPGSFWKTPKWVCFKVRYCITLAEYVVCLKICATCSFILELEHAHRIFQGENLTELSPCWAHLGAIMYCPKSVTFVGVAWLSRRWELMDLAGSQEICV